MPNRQLSSDELEKLFSPFLSETRERLDCLSGGDEDLHWALRRKLFKELSYDERWYSQVAVKLDEKMIEVHRRTISLLFAAGEHKRIAVKIFDDRGIESLKVLEVEE